MFNIAVNNLVQSIGGNVYIPSLSLAASKNLAPLSLVERESGYLPLSTFRDYYTTEFNLNDVLQDKGVKFDIEADQPFCTFKRTSTVKTGRKLEGSLTRLFDAGVKSESEVIINAPFGAISSSEVNLQSLLSKIRLHKLNMCHELIGELSGNKWKALCVVTGVIKTTTDTVITANLNNSRDLDLGEDDSDEGESDDRKKISTIGTVVEAIVGSVADAGISTDHETTSERTLQLPAGTVLGYQVMELAITDEGAARLRVSHGLKGGFHLKSLAVQQANSSYSVKSYLAMLILSMGLTLIAAGYSSGKLKWKEP
ncbi:pejvakin-like [Watersipora subatra]|uniref:pejvakin-like n=1 Tax=Watersipora subatra TaxID=2589382 RepID=UPI00355AD5C4